MSGSHCNNPVTKWRKHSRSANSIMSQTDITIDIWIGMGWNGMGMG
jgi:hypothetical protein